MKKKKKKTNLLFHISGTNFKVWELKYEGMLISPWPNLLPEVVGRNRQCRKEGYVCVPIASLFLLQRLKGSMSGNVGDFNNMET